MPNGPQLAAALLAPVELPELDEPLDDEPVELDGFDPPDESDDPPEPAVAATFLSPPLSPDFLSPAGLSPEPFDGAVLVAAALESVR